MPTPTSYPGAIDPSIFYSQAQPGIRNYARQSGSGLLNAQAGPTFQNIGAFGNLALPIGYSNLASILASQGRTDPAAMNLDLTNIARNTQAQQQGLSESLAQAGLQGSGLGAGLGAAIGQGGARMQAERQAQETQMAEARKRQDLDLMLRLLIDPSMQGLAIQRNYQAQSRGGDPTSAILGAVGQIAPYAALAFAACWVARATFGNLDPRWVSVRRALDSHPELRSFYLAYGRSVASFVRRSPWLKRAFRAPMLVMIGEA